MEMREGERMCITMMVGTLFPAVVVTRTMSFVLQRDDKKSFDGETRREGEGERICIKPLGMYVAAAVQELWIFFLSCSRETMT
jgi:hypothetical protein